MTAHDDVLAHAPDSRRHPSVLAVAEARSRDVQLRVADAITKFAGSMTFVYAHVLAFALWMLLVEKSPWPTLTLVVSLEAIFLSTFVMIGQNRQADFQQKKADHDFVANELELKSNTEITKQIAELTKQIHQVVVAQRATTKEVVALARVEVNDLDAALPFYESLAGTTARLFEFNGLRLAWVGAFLLLQGPPEVLATVRRVATLLVSDIDAAHDLVATAGGEILEDPAPGPNGARMIARHPDGSVFEYIER